MEEKKYYLYHKISPLGLNYLGITQRDPYKYMGSGKYWKRHLNAHEFICKDIETIILFETYNKEELVEKSAYYSEKFDVVNSENWANLIPENGGNNPILGVKLSEEIKDKFRYLTLGTKHSLKTKNKMSRARKGKIHSEETKKKLSQSHKGKKFTKTHKDKLSNLHKGKKFTQEHKNKIGENNKGISRNKGKVVSEETKRKLSILNSGRNKPNYKSIPINQYDLKGNLLKEWKDSVELKEAGFRYLNVSLVCRNIRKTAFGFIWKFK